jgi:hypothetical protein
VLLFEGADSTRVEAVIGDSIRVRFEDIVERVLPVRVVHTGAPAPGMVLGDALRSLTPMVRVRGARSRVFANGLDSIPAAPIDLSALSGTDTLNVALDTTGLGLLSVSTPTVDIVVPIRLAPVDTLNQGDVALLSRRR